MAAQDYINQLPALGEAIESAIDEWEDHLAESGSDSIAGLLESERLARGTRHHRQAMLDALEHVCFRVPLRFKSVASASENPFKNDATEGVFLGPNTLIEPKHLAHLRLEKHLPELERCLGHVHKHRDTLIESEEKTQHYERLRLRELKRLRLFYRNIGHDDSEVEMPYVQFLLDRMTELRVRLVHHDATVSEEEVSNEEDEEVAPDESEPN